LASSLKQRARTYGARASRVQHHHDPAGEGLATTYEVDASPHQPTPQDILKRYKEKKINLDALFDGKTRLILTSEARSWMRRLPPKGGKSG
jgi:hypothetical protein